MNRLMVPALVLLILLFGCATPEGPKKGSASQGSVESDAREELPTAVRTDPVDDLVIARSVRPEAVTKAKPADPRENMRKRFAEIGRNNLLVVRARVASVSASNRKVPEALYWGPYPHIVTTLKLRVVETYCGPARESLIASYVGGRLPDGTTEVTELTPQQLAVGMEHVFILRSVGDEYFLELGREDMLRRNVDGRFVDTSKHAIELKYLREACQ